VSRHTKSPVGKFAPSPCFSHIHVDIVGPLPQSRNKQYCLTIIDRTTARPEAIPTNRITVEAVAQLLVKHRISRFGAPLFIQSNQGRQFKSKLFRSVSELLGAKKVGTTCFHPASNGKVERWHCTLKASICA